MEKKPLGLVDDNKKTKVWSFYVLLAVHPNVMIVIFTKLMHIFFI